MSNSIDSTATARSTEATAASSTTSESNTSENSSLISSDVFLQLLVAELQYQNPLDPMDGTEYVQQLAQLSEVESSAAILEEVQGIREDIEAALGS